VYKSPLAVEFQQGARAAHAGNLFVFQEKQLVAGLARVVRV
jgi:hypothetical protein